MNNNEVNTSFFASMSDFSQTENEKFSRAKLSVFYKGLTADGREFSDEMSEYLVKSLPYTPIVSHYDEEKGDFVGHSSQQEIYGIVDPCRKSSFKTDENGQQWCVCDVVLYTDRTDKVGQIASKIVGKHQSLELDPRTVEYSIETDENQKVRKIVFNKGEFIGISVLGDDQEPAFTGSSFFTVDEEFENKMRVLKDFCMEDATEEEPEESPTLEEPKDEIVETVVEDNICDAAVSSENETVESNVENIEKEQFTLAKFLELSHGDIQCVLESALSELYGYNFYIENIFSDYVIAIVWSEETGEAMRLKHMYTINEDTSVVLEPAKKVVIAYDEIVEKQENEEFINVDEDIVHETSSTPENEIEGVNNEQTSISSASALNNSEEEELKAFRRKEKQEILDSFKELLSEEEQSKYAAEMDEFDRVEFKKELSALCFDRVKSKKSDLRIVGYATNNYSPKTKEERVADFIRNI